MRLAHFGDERPPQISSSATSDSHGQGKWIPRFLKHSGPQSEERHNAIFRNVRGTLNKLTPEKFDKLSLELLNVGIDSQVILKGIILLIFDKALDEAKYSTLYAQLCHRLCEDAPNFDPPSSPTTTFKRLLLNKCRDEFENRSKVFEAFDKKDGSLSPEEDEQFYIARRKMLGNIKFIGELGKLEMLHEGILHRCIQALLEKKKHANGEADVSEDLECLCQIMRTVGKRLDTEKARLWMDQYFERMHVFMGHQELPSRVRFMLQDVLELRACHWRPRKILADTGPKTITQIRESAAKEYGFNIPPGSMPSSPPFNMEFFNRSMNGHPRPSMDKFFGNMNAPLFGNNNAKAPAMGGMETFAGHSNYSGSGATAPILTGPRPRGGQYARSNRDTDRERNSRDVEVRDLHNRYRNNRSPYGNRNNSPDQDMNNRSQPPRFNKDSPRNNSPRNNSPLNNSPRTHSPRDGPPNMGRSQRDQNGDEKENGRDNSRGQRGGDSRDYDNRGSRQQDRLDGKNDYGDRERNFSRNRDRDFGGRDRDGNDSGPSRSNGNWKNSADGNDTGPSRSDGNWKTSADGNDTGPSRSDGNWKTPRDQTSNRGFESRPDHDRDRGFGNDSDRFGRGSGGNYQRSGQQQQQPQQAAARELPPRFQRMQQKQQQPEEEELPTAPPPSQQTPPHQQPFLTQSPIAGGPPIGVPPHQAPRFPPQQQGFFPPPFSCPPHGGPGPRYTPPPPQQRPSQSNSPRSQQGGTPPGSYSQGPPMHRASGLLDDINLRPPKNFTPMFRPNTPSMLPKSAQSTAPPMLQPQRLGPPEQAHIPNPSAAPKQPTNLTIQHVPAPDKDKGQKDRAAANQKGVGRDEMYTKLGEILIALVDNQNVDEAKTAVLGLRLKRKLVPEMVAYFGLETLDKAEADRENVSTLFLQLKEEGILAADLFMTGFGLVLEQMADKDREVPLVKSNVARLAAQAVANDIITLEDLSELMEQGAHYPLFLLCLQQIHKVRSKEWLTTAFHDSKLDLLSMLPECDRNKERMMEILEDRGLNFLFPLLRVQAELWKVIRADPAPNSVYKWIKDTVDPSVQGTERFINILVSNVLRYITGESTMKEGAVEADEKELLEKEKDMLEKYKAVLQKFLVEHVDLQVTAIYALQVVCHNHDFPKGMMLRMFIHLYDMDVIEESAFLRWKEEVNDEFPGKGKALFQVNQWLTWLEQAEEEEDSGEEDN